MESSVSPVDVMRVAYRLGNKHLPAYSHQFSRKDRCTLPQLFACLALREFYHLSFRRLEALLRDCRDLRQVARIKTAPDHNTLCDAFDKLTGYTVFAPMLDELVAAFEEAGLLKLDEKPLALDSTHFESHHVSRHFAERRKQGNRKKDQSKAAERDTRKKQGGKRKAAPSATRSDTVSNLPKLALAVACSCHLVLSMWAGTGMGGDHPHFETLVYHAWKRAPVKTIVADAGYDKEDHHNRVRNDMNCDSYIPPLIGRPTDKAPADPWRALMKQVWDTPQVKAIYGQRWQEETVNSMIKRNYGSSLRAKTPERREREMLLKAMVHNFALL